MVWSHLLLHLLVPPLPFCLLSFHVHFFKSWQHPHSFLIPVLLCQPGASYNPHPPCHSSDLNSMCTFSGRSPHSALDHMHHTLLLPIITPVITNYVIMGDLCIYCVPYKICKERQNVFCSSLLFRASVRTDTQLMLYKHLLND